MTQPYNTRATWRGVRVPRVVTRLVSAVTSGLPAALGIVAVLALGSCDPDIGYGRRADDGVLSTEAPSLIIRSPVLNRDGSLMAFHFYQQRGYRRNSRYRIAVYDLRNQNVQIIGPGDERYEWHSPSFSPSGDRLTFISACSSNDCPPARQGTQIVVYDLTRNSWHGVTEGNVKRQIWQYLSGSSSVQLVTAFVRRTSPVFSHAGDEIYFLVGWLTPDLLVDEAGFTLGAIDLETRNERLLLRRESGATYFAGDGSLAVAGPSELVTFAAMAYGGNKEDVFRDRWIFGYSYDLSADSLTALFSRSLLPRPDSQTQPEHNSLTVSLDGAKLAYIDGGAKRTAVLWEAGRQRPVVKAADIHPIDLGDLALSGDGRHLAIVPRPYQGDESQGSFLMLDLSTRAFWTLPLEPALMNALAEGTCGPDGDTTWRCPGLSFGFSSIAVTQDGRRQGLPTQE